MPGTVEIEAARRSFRTAGWRRTAEEVFDEFLAANPGADCSLVLLDAAGVVRVRRDADAALAALLDGVLLVPGLRLVRACDRYDRVLRGGAREGRCRVTGPEHYHAQLRFLAEPRHS